MDEEGDEGSRLLHAGMKVDRQLERPDDVNTLTEIIHYYREKRARSSGIALAIVKFVKEGRGVAFHRAATPSIGGCIARWMK